MRHMLSRRQFLKSAGMTTATVCTAGLLSACGSGSSGSSSGAASADTSSYTILYSSQPSTLNYLTTSSDVEMVVGANCVDTLLEFDNKGALKEGLATSWEFDEATLTWTFHLRDENWVDMNGEVVAPVTAQDFVDALRYLLTPDYAASNVGLVTSYIAGADEYYNYQVNLTNANNGYVGDDGTTYTVDTAGVVTVAAPGAEAQTFQPVDFDAVGVKAVDEHTLTYTLTYNFPGFLSLLVYLPYEPAYGPLLEEMGDQFATSAETTYSCGAFYLAEYIPLESWVMKKNPENYDADNVFIETVSRIYNAEADVNGPEMVKRGEIDEATIGADILDSWLADESTKDLVSMDRPNTNYTYFYLFNFMPFYHEFSGQTVEGLDDAYEPENWAKAINSTNFRKAFLYGINNSVTLAVTAPEGYEGYKLNTVTPPSFCANDDGVDYTQCGDLASITEFFDEAKAKEYRDAAIQELTAQGVTFPVKVQLPYNPSTNNWDRQCQIFKQQLEGVLNDGADFIDIIITEGPSDNYLSAVRRAGKYCFQLCNWGADYSDPETETDPFYQAAGERGGRYAYLRTGVEDGFITGETADAIMAYMTAVEEAKAITGDINARYDAFAKAEAMLINNALVIPMGMSVPAYLATRLNYWEGQYASTGFSNKRLKGIHVLDHYVSMSEYEANRDAR
ncbi:ABC transporter substrate-binding protein [Faecalibacterium sp. An122]|uniref:ABC transporter substrate-binding protein n=1 Tax=Faecalibacterium sp. An122 TaxID=1965551 RepID=UPI000B36B380|nr:ABC transporter substrate-binding protein [Faecalibacterium sp. An122]OUQ39347.1 ABC transporter substrate-binding protein [Faecalibacterium sp. An122]